MPRWGLHGLIDHLLATMPVENSAQAETTAAYFWLLRRSAQPHRRQVPSLIL